MAASARGFGGEGATAEAWQKAVGVVCLLTKAWATSSAAQSSKLSKHSAPLPFRRLISALLNDYLKF
jgi:hypothetical protein